VYVHVLVRVGVSRQDHESMECMETFAKESRKESTICKCNRSVRQFTLLNHGPSLVTVLKAY